MEYHLQDFEVVNPLICLFLDNGEWANDCQAVINENFTRTFYSIERPAAKQI